MVDKKKSEREAIDDVVKRLKKKYPDIPGKHIEQIVDDNYTKLQNAKLRDYIPVLVEHGAKSEIVKAKHKG
ncbi:three-helix bundle dimerization domain-containing protein [Glaciibacter sp. 2TAF33]|uniref:three-helix bundle dimerization domain-containing protein n=1 Tax=Glaciibacter sp. 2TAF33 TaxID=3233015 RepID=UPI003F914335